MKYLEYRLKNNLTQQELADKLCISKNHISQIERGLKQPSVILLVHLAAIFGTCPCILLDYSCHDDYCNPDRLGWFL